MYDFCRAIKHKIATKFIFYLVTGQISINLITRRGFITRI